MGQDPYLFTNKMYIMKKLFFALIFLPLIINSQNFKIKYEYEVPNGARIYYELKTNGEYSEFSNLMATESDKQNVTLYSNDKKFFVLKDLKDNLLISTDFLGRKRIIIKDSLNILNWQLVNNSNKTILGIECEMAKASFRGRNYIAYYNPNIKIQDGPWKFQGLPGLILEIYSEDDEYRYQAIEISKIPTFPVQKINYPKDNLYSWSSFKQLYINYVDNLISYFKTEKKETGFTDYYKINKPEIIHEKAQTGNGIEY